MFRRRRRGDALGRPVFKRRWVVLDSNNLIVYDGINLESGVPTRRKDSVSLNGIEWTLERNIKATKDLAWCFALAHSHQDSIYFAFEDERAELLRQWDKECQRDKSLCGGVVLCLLVQKGVLQFVWWSFTYLSHCWNFI